ncbi:MAG: hypothetical protein KAY65_04900 [Planctomycetes bacterium]|nr:hypothetical protein [Planctomycetota bacterium]
MEPVAFLDLANDLCKQSNNEAALRSAVSRGYYGLFHLIKRFVEDNVQTLTKDAESHRKVYQYLNNCGLREIEEVAGNLNELRDDRNDADYDLKIDKFQDANIVVLVFLKARSAYKTFEEFCKNSENRRKLVRGILDYKKKINN